MEDFSWLHLIYIEPSLSALVKFIIASTLVKTGLIFMYFFHLSQYHAYPREKFNHSFNPMKKDALNSN